MVEVRGKVLLTTVQESLRLQVCSTKRQEIDGSQSGLLARGDEYNDGEFGRVFADGVVDGFHHGNEAGGSMGDGEALDVQLQRNWPNVWVEAEKSVRTGPEPLAQILGVGHR